MRDTTGDEEHALPDQGQRARGRAHELNDREQRDEAAEDRGQQRLRGNVEQREADRGADRHGHGDRAQQHAPRDRIAAGGQEPCGHREVERHECGEQLVEWKQLRAEARRDHGSTEADRAFGAERDQRDQGDQRERHACAAAPAEALGGGGGTEVRPRR